MNREEMRELLQYVGEADSVVGMRDYTLNEGMAKGMRVIDVRNGNGLELTLLPDRCLDIAYFRLRGVNIGYASKTGLVAPQFFVEDGARGFLKSFNAGMLTTGGITYAGGAGEYNGVKHGLHGVIGNTAADHVNKELVYGADGEAVLRVTGRMREVEVFGQNMVMERAISVDTKANVVTINDVVRNEGFAEQLVMNVYHVNFGYPLLNEGARVYFSAKNMQPRDEVAQKGAARYNVMEKPAAGRPEECFFHTDDKPQKDSFAMLVSADGKLAVAVHYNEEQCPLLCEWKCLCAGDYALGLEPTVSGVMGAGAAEKAGMLRKVEPGGEYRMDISLEVLEEEERIKSFIEKAAK
ncbi:MAG TPA: hypothetical protein DEB31_10865 [Clostridiales bacterium]|nr:hypothetical protein [Clostridiales bacterium]